MWYIHEGMSAEKLDDLLIPQSLPPVEGDKGKSFPTGNASDINWPVRASSCGSFGSNIVRSTPTGIVTLGSANSIAPGQAAAYRHAF